MVASWACEVNVIFTQRCFFCASSYKDLYDVTSPASNQIPDVNLAISVEYKGRRMSPLRYNKIDGN